MMNDDLMMYARTHVQTWLCAAIAPPIKFTEALEQTGHRSVLPAAYFYDTAHHGVRELSVGQREALFASLPSEVPPVPDSYREPAQYWEGVWVNLVTDFVRHVAGVEPPSAYPDVRLYLQRAH